MRVLGGAFLGVGADLGTIFETNLFRHPVNNINTLQTRLGQLCVELASADVLLLLSFNIKTS